MLVMLSPHPVHETFAEIEWDAKTGRMEVAVRLDVLDEQWIDRKIKSQPVGSTAVKNTPAEPTVSRSFGESGIDALRLRYLQSHFLFGNQPVENDREKQTKTDDYRWIGRKVDGAHVWWFFEFKPADGKRPTRLTQRMLLDRDERFQNRILVLGKSKLLLTTRRGHATVELADVRQHSAG